MSSTDSTKKTIQINPHLFDLSAINKNNTPKKQKKEKPVVAHMKNGVKEKLLAQVKKHQQDKKQQQPGAAAGLQGQKKGDDRKTFNDEFNSSLNFMEQLAQKRNEKQARQTMKRGRIEKELKQQQMAMASMTPPGLGSATHAIPGPFLKMNPLFSLATKPLVAAAAPPAAPAAMMPLPLTFNIPTSIKQPEPPMAPVIDFQLIDDDQPQDPVVRWVPKVPTYGCLKNGQSPTFRQTMRNNNNPPITTTTTTSSSINPLASRSVVSNAVKKAVAKKLLKQPHIKKRTNRTLKYKLGKHGKKMSVFIRNSATRKLVQSERDLLKHKTILEIKNYLRSKNLLKAGSLIPNDVLRQMYENVILAGDVTNKNGDVLLHNYFKDGTGAGGGTDGGGGTGGMYKF